VNVDTRYYIYIVYSPICFGCKSRFGSKLSSGRHPWR